MREEIFSIPAAGFVVFRNADGAMSWSNSYSGKEVGAALPLAGGTCCVILLDPDSSEKAAFRNLFCAERDGTIAWTAELPQTHDAFIDVQMDADGLHAQSWSGFNVTLNATTGQVIRQDFVK
jgi:hypothetical protein